MAKAAAKKETKDSGAASPLKLVSFVTRKMFAVVAASAKFQVSLLVSESAVDRLLKGSGSPFKT